MTKNETEKEIRIKLSQSLLSITERVRRGYVPLDRPAKRAGEPTDHDTKMLTLAHLKRLRRQMRNRTMWPRQVLAKYAI